MQRPADLAADNSCSGNRFVLARVHDKAAMHQQQTADGHVTILHSEAIELTASSNS
jgi:hypothetical protein